MRTLACLLVLLSLVGLSAPAQTTPSCPVAPAALNPTAPNIFNARQEQDLGDAYAKIGEAHLRFVNDSEAYLGKIGQGLLSVLQPNDFHFLYKIVDSPQVRFQEILERIDVAD